MFQPEEERLYMENGAFVQDAAGNQSVRHHVTGETGRVQSRSSECKRMIDQFCRECKNTYQTNTFDKMVRERCKSKHKYEDCQELLEAILQHVIYCHGALTPGPSTPCNLPICDEFAAEIREIISHKNIMEPGIYDVLSQNGQVSDGLVQWQSDWFSFNAKRTVHEEQDNFIYDGIFQQMGYNSRFLLKKSRVDVTISSIDLQASQRIVNTHWLNQTDELLNMAMIRPALVLRKGEWLYQFIEYQNSVSLTDALRHENLNENIVHGVATFLLNTLSHGHTNQISFSKEVRTDITAPNVFFIDNCVKLLASVCHNNTLKIDEDIRNWKLLHTNMLVALPHLTRQEAFSVEELASSIVNLQLTEAQLNETQLLIQSFSSPDFVDQNEKEKFFSYKRKEHLDELTNGIDAWNYTYQ